MSRGIQRSSFNPLTDAQRVELAKIFGDLVSKGAMTRTLEDENHVRQTLSMPELDKEPEEDPDKAKEPKKGPAGGGKGGTNPDDAEPSKNNALNFAKERQKTSYEERVDFKAIEKSLDTREADALESMRAIPHLNKGMLLLLSYPESWLRANSQPL